jgi:hypothetical protein
VLGERFDGLSSAVYHRTAVIEDSIAEIFLFHVEMEETIPWRGVKSFQIHEPAANFSKFMGQKCDLWFLYTGLIVRPIQFARRRLVYCINHH